MRYRLVLLALAFSTLLQAQSEMVGPFVLVIGPPGSGKSTQAKQIAATLRVPIVSDEELIENNPEAFEVLKKNNLSGMEPQTNPVLNRLFKERFQKGGLEKGVVLDGYPATKDHADFIAALVQAGELPNPLIIQLMVPDEVVRQRMAAGGGMSEAVEQRLKDYHREFDVLELYFPDADLEKIDGNKTPEKVKANIAKLLKKRFNR